MRFVWEYRGNVLDSYWEHRYKVKRVHVMVDFEKVYAYNYHAHVE